MSVRTAFSWTAFVLVIAAGMVVWLALGVTADHSTVHGRFLGPHPIHAVQ